MSDKYSQAIMEYSSKRSSLGQNFLRDSVKAEEFIKFCRINEKDKILEIGPGKGALTKLVTRKAKKVWAVEIDPLLAQNPAWKKVTNLKIINQDFLKIDLRALIKKKEITKIIGAVPYYISSPIIHKILEEAACPLKEVCLITQKEFAGKVLGTKKSRSYFTNLIERYAKIQKGEIIKRESFIPKPKVDSQYFKLIFKEYPENKEEVKEWSKFLHHVFLHPRKKINKKFDKNLLSKLNINPNLRPQNLTIRDIFKLVYNQKHDRH